MKLRHFLNRMASRSTPFGIFATVGTVDVETGGALSLEGDVRIRVRPDMSWVRAVAEKIESDEISKDELPLIVNDRAVALGGRLYISDVENIVGNASAGKADHSIRLLPIVEDVERLARQGLSRGMIRRRLADQYQTDEASVGNVIATLEQIRFVRSGVPLTPLSEPLETLIGTTASMPEVQGPLYRVRDAIDSLGGKPKSISRFRRVESAMRSVAPTERLTLAVDAVRTFSGTLPEHVLADAGRLLTLLSYHVPKVSLEEYREAFISRYGFSSRPVPLVEMLDPNLGLGPPPSQEKATKVDLNDVQSAARMEIAIRAIRAGTTEKDVSESDFASVFGAAYAPAELPERVEFCFRVLATSADALAERRYRLAPSGAHAFIGTARSMGRFADMLDDTGRKTIERALSGESELDPCEWYELVYLPRDSNAANVLLRPWVSGERIDLGLANGGIETLRARDILVSAEGDAFRLWNRKSGKRIRIRESHLVNTPRFGDPIAQFLSLSQHDGTRLIGTFVWGAAEALPMLPRIRYGNLVLSPQTWKMPYPMFRMKGSQAADAIRHFLRRWNVPPVVLAGHLDRQIVVRTEGDDAIETLMALGRDALDQRPLILEEAFEGFDEPWLESASGRHSCEFLATFERNVPAPALRNIRVADDEGQRRPADWSYVRLYVGMGHADRLLVHEISPFLQRFREEDWADRWFFIRYTDANAFGYHVRLRVRASEKQSERVRKEVLEWAEGLLQSRTINHYSYEPYERELERYGGAAAYDAIEQVFQLDSEAALEAITRFPNVEEKLAWTIASAHTMMDSLLSDSRLLNSHYDRLSPKPYRLQESERRIVNRAAAMIFDGQGAAPEPLQRALLTVNEAAGEGRLVEPLSSIAYSLRHMHMNRCGITRADEESLDKVSWHLNRRLTHGPRPEQ